MAISPLQLSGFGSINNNVDPSQWSTLANLGNVYQKAQQDKANQRAFAQYQQTGDPKALIGSGDLNLAQLGINAQNHMDALKQQALENARSESHWADELKYKYKALDQADKPKYHYTTNEWGETEAYKETDKGLERVPLDKAIADSSAAMPGAAVAPAAAASSFPAPLPSQIAARPAFPAPLPQPPAPAPQPAVDLHAALGIPQPQTPAQTPGQAAPQVAPAGLPAPPISTDNVPPLASLANLAPPNVPAWAQPPQALGGAQPQQQVAPDEPPSVMSGVKFNDLNKEAEYQPKARNEGLLAQIAAHNQNIATIVKGVADGEIDPRTLQKKQQQFIASLVKQYDPTYDQGTMAGRFKAKQEFLSGGPNSPASTLVTGATAIGHIYDAFQNQKELGGTGSYGYLNKLLNKANVFGMELADSTPLSAYNTNIGKVAEEGTKFYRGTGGTESDISRDIGSMSASHSPQSRVRTLAESATMMMAKVSGLQDRWKNAIGEKNYNEEIARSGGNFIMTQDNLSKVNEIRNAAGLKPVDMRGREISAAARAAQLKASGVSDQGELFERLHREGF